MRYLLIGYLKFLFQRPLAPPYLEPSTCFKQTVQTPGCQCTQLSQPPLLSLLVIDCVIWRMTPWLPNMVVSHWPHWSGLQYHKPQPGEQFVFPDLWPRCHSLVCHPFTRRTLCHQTHTLPSEGPFAIIKTLCYHKNPLSSEGSSAIRRILGHQTDPLPLEGSTAIRMTLCHQKDPLPSEGSSAIRRTLCHQKDLLPSESGSDKLICSQVSGKHFLSGMEAFQKKILFKYF